MIEEHLRLALHEAADELPAPSGAPRVIARARRRILATSAVLAAVLVAAAATSVTVVRSVLPASKTRPAYAPVVDERGLDVLPVPGHRDVPTPLEDQAAVFAARAVANAGLLDPLGPHFALSSIEAAGDGWRAGFAGATCGIWDTPEGRVETCKPQSGFDEARNGIEDSWLEVELQDGAWTVTAVEGRFPEDARADLISFSLDQVAEDPHWEVPTALVSREAGGDEGVIARGSMLWVGPLPYGGPGTVCRVAGLDADGEVVFRDLPRYQEAPPGASERRGGITTAPLPDDPSIADARFECAAYEGAGWQAERVVLEGTESASSQVIVHADLVWEDEGVVLAQSRCVASVFDEDGSLLASSDTMLSEFWPPQKAERPPPYEAQRTFTVRVGDPARAARAEVECKLV